MKRTMLFVVLGIMGLLSSLVGSVTFADEGTPDTGQLSVPWEEFKSLLNLDDDRIVLSLETFQKLLAQTTPTVPPPHAVHEGNVVLTRTAFQQLVDQMTPHGGSGTRPPFDHLMTKAIYSGEMQRENTLFTGTFHVNVLSPDLYLKIPILPQSIALEDVTVDESPALVVSENGYHHVVLSTAGEHVVIAAFSLRSSADQGPQKLDLATVVTPITLLRLDLPLSGIEVEVPQAQQLVTRVDGDRTVVSAVISSGNGISVRWRDQVALVEKIPPKLYSEVFHVLSIEDDVLKVSSDISFNILHSEVGRVRLSIPDGMNVLSVQGEGVGEWQELPEGDEGNVLVPFTYGRKGAVTIRVVAEKPLADDEGVTTFSGIRVLDTVRETGFIGIEVKTSAEVTIVEHGGLEPIGVQKLPQALQARAVKPLMHGFKYLKHPYNLAVSIRKHEKVAVPVAAISSTNAVTLFTQDGKVVHRVVYQVRNSAKQFLEIGVPENADIWTVFVDNQPVESALNGKGKLLVPLIRSRVVNNNLNSFPVEVVYCLVQEEFSSLAVREATLPPVDLLISQLIWSVYLPNDYAYVHFSSTLEKEEMIRALNLFTGSKRQYNESAMKKVHEVGGMADGDRMDDKLTEAYEGKDYRSQFRNLPLDEEQLSSQVHAELEFGRRLEAMAKEDPSVVGGVGQGSVFGPTGGTGVLPIQIQVPTGGQVYRFARTIIRPEDPLTMSVNYGASWLMSSVKWACLLLAAVVLYLNRRFLRRSFAWIGGSVGALVEFCRRYAGVANKLSQSVMTPVILLGLLGPIWFVSIRLAALVLFLLWVTVIYQIVLRSRRRAVAGVRPGE